jgi:hypothetical protein|tara:strand:- start:174 stop:566 length:393 start_codon:yes stop_codon:yes gene_type:complete
MRDIKIHFFNLYLSIILAILGILLRVNRIYLVFDPLWRVAFEHFIAFLFFPIAIITWFFILTDKYFWDKPWRNILKYWIIVTAIAFNVGFIIFWEVDVQHFNTSYQIIIDFLATIISFGYLYWYYLQRNY